MLKIRLLIAILSGFTLASLLSGCFSSKAAVGAKVEKSPVAQVPHKPKIDTIKITEVDPTKYPPITNSSNKKNEPTIEKGIVTNFQSQFKDGYQIAGFFPMYSQKQMEIAKINDNVLRIIQFYNGMKMGLEQLGSEGIKVSLSTYDIAGGDTVKTLLSKFPRKPDLIIGPYKMDNIVTAVDYATKNQIQVLSPWTTPGALGQVFSNIVYCRPSIKSHAEKAIQLLKSSCTDGKIIGVCRKSDIRQQNLWQNFKAVLVNNDINVEECLLSDTISKAETSALSSLIDGQKCNYIFLPYMYEDVTISQLLRKVNGVRNGRNVKIIGFESWLDLPKCTPELIMGSNIQFIAPYFYDKEDEKMNLFAMRYLNRFGCLPEGEAFYGYDVMLWAGRMLKKYGTIWLGNGLNAPPPGEGYFQPFIFKKNALMGNSADSDVEYFQNTKVQAFEYKEFKFRPIETN
jgi:ABC-type branched-subunit amino acid transport system substrate-binding protein